MSEPRRFADFAEMELEFWRIWAEEGVEGLHARYEDFFTEGATWSPPTAQVGGHDYAGRDGGTLDSHLITIVQLVNGRMAYGFGTYDPEAAAQKLAELQAGQETADA